mmetsp:Transcript_4131/g.9671  ORF Transcript_4131/g.9671 Transcript_4131/m.9671 type:complete len:486 (-) Transcript_4131:130-1587(-)
MHGVTLRCLLCTVVSLSALRPTISLHLQPADELRPEALSAGHSAAPQHLWPHSMYKSSFTHIVPPRNLSAHLAFTWHHPQGRFGTVLAGGPVIDANGNFYLAGQDHFRKLSPKGEQIWEFRPPSGTNNMPCLGDGVMLGNSKGGQAFALDLETGKPRWVKQIAPDLGGDSGYPSSHKGLFVLAADVGHIPGHDGGNTRIVALNESTGDMVWNVRIGIPVWNFQPLFCDDDESFVFMDFSGGMFRLSLHNGEKIWHTPAPLSSLSFTDGGAVLGGDMAFSCSNPGVSSGTEGTLGVVRALRIKDGSFVWEHLLPQPCNSYPAYGPLGPGKKPSVVITPGSFMGSPVMHGSVMAFDAATGGKQWQFQAKPWKFPFNMARGDVEGYYQRTHTKDPYVGSICLPAHWGSPAISRSGVVYVGRSDGFLYAIRGVTENPPGPMPILVDFSTSPGVEVEMFDALGSALHGSTAWAPGILAFQTCDSLWVFKF